MTDRNQEAKKEAVEKRKVVREFIYREYADGHAEVGASGFIQHYEFLKNELDEITARSKTLLLNELLRKAQSSQAEQEPESKDNEEEPQPQTEE